MTYLLLCSLSLSSCSIVDHLRKRDSKSAVRQVKPFVPEAHHRQPPQLPEFGDASALESEPFILQYNRIAEVSSLLGEGKASWYGPNFHGRLTASGERYDMYALTAAHPTLPFNTLVWVENPDNGRSALVRINDRGPYSADRIIDLSREAAKKLKMRSSGIARVNLYLAKKDRRDYLSGKVVDRVYTIQLAAFRTVKEALAFARKIKESRVEIVNENDKTYYGVFYGFYVERSDAFRKKRELEQQENFTGFIREFGIRG